MSGLSEIGWCFSVGVNLNGHFSRLQFCFYGLVVYFQHLSSRIDSFFCQYRRCYGLNASLCLTGLAGIGVTPGGLCLCFTEDYVSHSMFHCATDLSCACFFNILPCLQQIATAWILLLYASCGVCLWTTHWVCSVRHISCVTSVPFGLRSSGQK